MQASRLLGAKQFCTLQLQSGCLITHCCVIFKEKRCADQVVEKVMNKERENKATQNNDSDEDGSKYLKVN